MPWKTSWVECRMCKDQHVSVWPVPSLMEDCQECPNCGNMTCEPIDEEQVVRE